jgi:hypothetical protein
VARRKGRHQQKKNYFSLTLTVVARRKGRHQKKKKNFISSLAKCSGTPQGAPPTTKRKLSYLSFSLKWQATSGATNNKTNQIHLIE